MGPRAWPEVSKDADISCPCRYWTSVRPACSYRRQCRWLYEDQQWLETWQAMRIVR